MKRHVSIGVAIATLIACASDDETAPPSTLPADVPDAHVDVVDAGAASDAGADADAPIDADAPKTCSDDGWCHTAVPANQVLRDVWSDGLGGAWAVSDQGNVLRYDGKAWTIAYTHAAADVRLFSIWGSGPSDIWIGGYRAVLHGTGANPANLTWTMHALDDLAADGAAVSVYGTSAVDVFAVTGTSVLHYDGAWAIDPVTTAIAGKAIEVWGRADTNDAWISTVNATSKKSVLFHRAEGAWSQAEGVSEVPFNVVSRPCATPGEPRRGWMVDDKTVWLIGTRINFLNPCHFVYSGVAGDAGAYGFSGSYFYDPYLRQNDIWGSSPSDVWLAGDFGALHHWDGKSWQLPSITIDEHPVKKNLNAIFGRGPSNIWVVGDQIAIHKGTL